MVQEVKDSVIAQWERMDTVRLDVSQGFAQIESAVLSVGTQLRHVVVENAQKFHDRHWEFITDWAWAIVQGKLQVLLTITSDEEKPNTILERYRPFVEKGRFVECKQVTAESLEKYCVDDYGLSADNAAFIIDLCGYNFIKLNNELEKLRFVYGSNIQRHDIESLVVFTPQNLVVKYLLERNGESASKVVHTLIKSEISEIFRTLVVKLSFFLLVYKLDKPGMGAHRLATAAGCQPWQLLEYFSMKKHWTVTSLQEKLKLLTEFEDVWSKTQSNILGLLCRWW